MLYFEQYVKKLFLNGMYVSFSEELTHSDAGDIWDKNSDGNRWDELIAHALGDWKLSQKEVNILHSLANWENVDYKNESLEIDNWRTLTQYLSLVNKAYYDELLEIRDRQFIKKLREMKKLLTDGMSLSVNTKEGLSGLKWSLIDKQPGVDEQWLEWRVQPITEEIPTSDIVLSNTENQSEEWLKIYKPKYDKFVQQFIQKSNWKFSNYELQKYLRKYPSLDIPYGQDFEDLNKNMFCIEIVITLLIVFCKENDLKVNIPIGTNGKTLSFDSSKDTNLRVFLRKLNKWRNELGAWQLQSHKVWWEAFWWLCKRIKRSEAGPWDYVWIGWKHAQMIIKREIDEEDNSQIGFRVLEWSMLKNDFYTKWGKNYLLLHYKEFLEERYSKKGWDIFKKGKDGMFFARPWEWKKIGRYVLTPYWEELMKYLITYKNEWFTEWDKDNAPPLAPPLEYDTIYFPWEADPEKESIIDDSYQFMSVNWKKLASFQMD